MKSKDVFYLKFAYAKMKITKTINRCYSKAINWAVKYPKLCDLLWPRYWFWSRKFNKYADAFDRIWERCNKI